MKLNEITKIVQQPDPGFKESDFDIENAQQVTTAENFPVFKLKSKGNLDPALEAYALKKDDRFVSFVVGKYGTLDGPAFFVQRSYTIPSLRNKGLATALYSVLYRRLHLKLISDVEQSPETVSVWKKLSKSLPVRVLDTKNQRSLELQDVPDKQLYDPELELKLVIENTHTLNIQGGQPITDLLIPERPLIDKILADYINYTASENDGLYE